MANYSVIDADGHLIEQTDLLRSYLKPPYDKRSGPLFHGEPWDGHLQGTLPTNREWCRRDLKAPDWLQVMDKHNMELAFLYSTGAGDVSRVRESGYALALCRAYNDYVHDRYRRLSDHLYPMALIPFQDTGAAVQELRRAVKEMGFVGAMVPSTGLPLHLGHEYYWPIYEEAMELDCALGVHGGYTQRDVMEVRKDPWRKHRQHVEDQKVDVTADANLKCR